MGARDDLGRAVFLHPADLRKSADGMWRYPEPISPKGKSPGTDSYSVLVQGHTRTFPR